MARAAPDVRGWWASAMRDENDVSKGTLALIGGVFLVVPGGLALSVQEAGPWGWLMLSAGVGLMVWGAFRFGRGQK